MSLNVLLLQELAHLARTCFDFSAIVGAEVPTWSA
jgi:hypothetical protein